VIDFEGRNWDAKGCGAVTVTASGERGAVPIDTFNESDFKGKIKVNGRLCGLKLFAEQASGRKREASFGLGDRTQAVVLLADPGITPEGDQLFQGDYLCKSEARTAAGALDSGQLSGATVSTVAQNLSQRLLELAVPGGDRWLADAAGNVAVHGITGESVPLPESQEFTSSLPGAQQLPVTVSGDENLSGVGETTGSHNVSGNLVLNHGILVVHGDLTVSGTISGIGAVLVTGNITAAGARFSTDDVAGLWAGGRLNLP
jgi:hypothetical protein